MAKPNRTFRDYRAEPEKALALRNAVIAVERARGPVIGTNLGKVIPPYYPRQPIDAGDAFSPSGALVELSELADDVVSAIGTGGAGAAFDLREVLLTFSALVPAGTAINVQTGAYAGAGSPAAVDNDTDVVLPTTGILFKDDGRIEVHLNGQDLSKGDGSGNGVAEWVSATQIKLNLKIKSGGSVLVRAPFPTA
jgi:hypothetical protein